MGRYDLVKAVTQITAFIQPFLDNPRIIQNCACEANGEGAHLTQHTCSLNSQFINNGSDLIIVYLIFQQIINL